MRAVDTPQTPTDEARDDPSVLAPAGTLTLLRLLVGAQNTTAARLTPRCTTEALVSGGMEMRRRSIGIGAGALLIAALIGFVGSNEAARATLQQGTPAATPAVPGAATPTAAVHIVTLVAWYQPDPTGAFLEIGPIRTNKNLVADVGKAAANQLTGQANFTDPANNDQPRITLGETVLDGFPVVAGDPTTVLRWLYFDDQSDARPATLVIQVNATAGPYKGYSGTATFVSRASGEGGVLVIVLNPPA